MARIHVSWMEHEDAKLVSRIDRICFSKPLGIHKFNSFVPSSPSVMTTDSSKDDLSSQRHHVLTTKIGSDVVGYVLYEVLDRSYRVVRIGVDPEYRRHGFGTMLIERLQACLCEKRSRAWTIVCQSNLPALKFFAHSRFRAVNTGLSFDANGSPGYWMIFKSPVSSSSRVDRDDVECESD